MSFSASPAGSEPIFPHHSGTPGASELVELEAKVERLLIITEALWTILKEKNGLEDQELARQMVQIDLRDGKLDGRVSTSPPVLCPKCNRVVGKNLVRCMFCGEPIVPQPFDR